MNNIKYIKAFTILEVVISLAIMSIIISMVYVIYVMLAEQLHNYTATTEAVNGYNHAHFVFKKDVFDSNKMESLPEGVRLITAYDTITYHCDGAHLSRQTSKQIDTLAVPITKIAMQQDQINLTTKHQCLAVSYLLLDRAFDGVYYKDYGIADDINLIFATHGN